MKLIKKQGAKYLDKDGKERHYYNYFLITDNGKSIQIKPSFYKDTVKLDMVAIYEK